MAKTNKVKGVLYEIKEKIFLYNYGTYRSHNTVVFLCFDIV